jgi:hypothetical protein
VIKHTLCTWWLHYTKLQVMFKVSPTSHQTIIDTRLTLTPSVIPNSNYFIMINGWNCLKHFCVFFLCCNDQVHRDFLITLCFAYGSWSFIWLQWHGAMNQLAVNCLTWSVDDVYPLNGQICLHLNLLSVYDSEDNKKLLYRAIKNSLCTWLVQDKKHAKIF